MENKFFGWSKTFQANDALKMGSRIFDGQQKILFKYKVKLHGTNAAIRVLNDLTLIPQSRNRDISVESDNHGFAKWVKDNEAVLKKMLPSNSVVYGEWAGPGIQSGVAVSQIPKRSFFIFGIADDPHYSGETNNIIMDYIQVRHALKYFDINTTHFPHNPEIGLYIIPDAGEFEVTFNDPTMDITFLEDIAKSVGDCDPLIKDLFGIEGPGEGIVCYPSIATYGDFIVENGPDGNEWDINRAELFKSLRFKVKDDRHKSRARKIKKPIDEKLDLSIKEFVDEFATEARMKQCLNELSISEFSRSQYGPVIKWMSQDILNESKQALEDASMTWKQVAGRVNARVKSLYESAF